MRSAYFCSLECGGLVQEEENQQYDESLYPYHPPKLDRPRCRLNDEATKRGTHLRAKRGTGDVPGQGFTMLMEKKSIQDDTSSYRRGHRAKSTTKPFRDHKCRIIVFRGHTSRPNAASQRTDNFPEDACAATNILRERHSEERSGNKTYNGCADLKESVSKTKMQKSTHRVRHLRG